MIVDDTVLDKPYSKKIDFVRYQWSEKHHRTVKGIGLITLLWTDGKRILPVDFRIYDIDQDSKTKNDHCLDMLDMDESERKDLANKSWKIEEYHRGIKQYCGVEKCQARKSHRERI